MNYEKNIYIIETVNLFNAFVFFRGCVKNKMFNRNIVVFHSMYTKHALEHISGAPPAEYSVRSPVLDRRSWRHVPASRSIGLNGFWEKIHKEPMPQKIFFSDGGGWTSLPPPPPPLTVLPVSSLYSVSSFMQNALKQNDRFSYDKIELMLT